MNSAFDKDDGFFVGMLFDTFLYERAVHRLYHLHRHDLPFKYSDLAQDFTAAYKLCIDLANPTYSTLLPKANLFAQMIRNGRLMTAKGVREFVKDQCGCYEIYPTDDDARYDLGITELDEDDFSDYDAVQHGFDKVKKKVGYEAPALEYKERRFAYSGQRFKTKEEEEEAANRELFLDSYFAGAREYQDMIAVIVHHLRTKVWKHDGSGGEIAKLRRTIKSKTDPQGKNGLEARSSTTTVLCVKKLCGKTHGLRKKANQAKHQARVDAGHAANPFFRNIPITDYSSSEDEHEQIPAPKSIAQSLLKTEENGTTEQDPAAPLRQLVLHIGAMQMQTVKSEKRPLHWLPIEKGWDQELLFDTNGPNTDLRLIDWPSVEVDTAFHLDLSRRLFDTYQTLLPQPSVLDRHKKLTDKLNRILRKAFPEELLTVEPFGSFVNGLLTDTSDADFCITSTSTTKSIHDHPLLNDMNHLAQILRSESMERVIAISNASVPIVKFYDPETRLEADLNTGNNLGVVNSELIRTYVDDILGTGGRRSAAGGVVKQFLYLLKAICKGQRINEPKNGTLSSYALTWMGIVFLQNWPSVMGSRGRSNSTRAPSLVPRLQQQPFDRMDHVVIENHTRIRGSLVPRKDSVHCRFDRNSDGRHSPPSSSSSESSSLILQEPSLSVLLLTFFEFYSRRFDYTETEINVPGGVFLKKSHKTRVFENRVPTLRIVDPFLLHKNVAARCHGDSLERVWHAFERVYICLSQGDVEGAMVYTP